MDASLRPPDEKIYVGGGDFEKIGRQWVDYFVAQCALKPGDTVLDVGSGIGRVAIPLADYLTGRYEGLDIVQDGVDWCSQNITPRFPNFHFQLADVYNEFYNPDGSQHPAEYRFPFEDSEFDFVFLISVFTHMRAQETEHYISEVSRVLKPGGRCLASALLMNETVPADRPPRWRFDQDAGSYCFNRGDVPETVLAYKEKFLLDLFEQYGFSNTADYGWWAHPASKTNLDAQDVVLALKR